MKVKTLHVKKLEHWCDVVRVRAENMLSSSLNTPATDNDSERDEEENDVSENDLKIVGEQSGTVDTTNSTDTVSGGTCRTEAPEKNQDHTDRR